MKNPVVPMVLAVAIFAMTSCYVDAGMEGGIDPGIDGIDADVSADDPDSRRVHRGHRLLRNRSAGGADVGGRTTGRTGAFIGPAASASAASSVSASGYGAAAVGADGDAAAGHRGVEPVAECRAVRPGAR